MITGIHHWPAHERVIYGKPAAEVSENLVCAVNGRFVYWGSKRPIPGGISFENFELREPFRSGQTFIFGITEPRTVLLPENRTEG